MEVVDIGLDLDALHAADLLGVLLMEGENRRTPSILGFSIRGGSSTIRITGPVGEARQLQLTMGVVLLLRSSE